MALITFYPLVFQVWMSFTSFELRNLRPNSPAPPFVGLENFRRILDNNIVIPNFDFLRILVFNLFWALSNVVIHVVLGVAIALILNVEGEVRGSGGRSTSCRSRSCRSSSPRSGGTCSTRSTARVNQLINGTVGVPLQAAAVQL
jgi:hypothetical protein